MEEPLVIIPRTSNLFPNNKMIGDCSHSFQAFSGLAPDYLFRGDNDNYVGPMLYFQKLHCGHPEAANLMKAYYDISESLKGRSIF